MYPDDCPDLFPPLESLKQKQLAELLHKVHSSFKLSIWGDHGPIDGRSHVLYLQMIRFYPFQFAGYRDPNILYKHFEHEVHPILVCRMSSEQSVTLASMRTVGDLYRNEGMKNVILAPGCSINGSLRWARGDLAFLAHVAMVQKGGNGKSSYCLPTSAIQRGDYPNYVMYDIFFFFF